MDGKRKGSVKMDRGRKGIKLSGLTYQLREVQGFPVIAEWY